MGSFVKVVNKLLYGYLGLHEQLQTVVTKAEKCPCKCIVNFHCCHYLSIWYLVQSTCEISKTKIKSHPESGSSAFAMLLR